MKMLFLFRIKRIILILIDFKKISSPAGLFFPRGGLTGVPSLFPARDGELFEVAVPEVIEEDVLRLLPGVVHAAYLVLGALAFPDQAVVQEYGALEGLYYL